MSNYNTKPLANVFGGKTARACDCCMKRRARWYCAADDAFLCQACDGSVHSANPLARRHERVRLKTSSSVGKPLLPSPPATTWHDGFTRKARTPRGGGLGKKNHRSAVVHHLVPEVSVEEQTENYEEEELIYRVPVFDPIVAEQREIDAVETKTDLFLHGNISINNDIDNYNNNNQVESSLNGFFPTDTELAEFAADVETLLGPVIETESFAMEELGLVDASLDRERSSPVIVKFEEEEEEEEGVISQGANKEYCDRGNFGTAFELGFHYDSRANYGEEDHREDKAIVKGEEGIKETSDGCEVKKIEKRKFSMLRLDYEAVIATWGDQGPPWTAGERPEFDLDEEWWPACMGANGAGEAPQHQYDAGIMGGGMSLHRAFADGGREARVSRYREKRRTRLFSKKIRYEVRKLNAEKRPRMKGRFVKRVPFAASADFASIT